MPELSVVDEYCVLTTCTGERPYGDPRQIKLP